MKYIKWISGAFVVAAAALVAILSQASVGDAIYPKRTLAAFTLNGTERTCVSNAIQTLAPRVEPSQFLSFSAEYNAEIGKLCMSGIRSTSVSSADYVKGSPIAGRTVSADGTTFFYPEPMDRKCVAQGVESTLLGCFASRGIDSTKVLLSMYISRPCIGNATDCPVTSSEIWQIVSGSPTQYGLDINAGVARDHVGVVGQ